MAGYWRAERQTGGGGGASLTARLRHARCACCTLHYWRRAAGASWAAKADTGACWRRQRASAGGDDTACRCLPGLRTDGSCWTFWRAATGGVTGESARHKRRHRSLARYLILRRGCYAETFASPRRRKRRGAARHGGGGGISSLRKAVKLGGGIRRRRMGGQRCAGGGGAREHQRASPPRRRFLRTTCARRARRMEGILKRCGCGTRRQHRSRHQSVLPRKGVAWRAHAHQASRVALARSAAKPTTMLAGRRRSAGQTKARNRTVNRLTARVAEGARENWRTGGHRLGAARRGGGVKRATAADGAAHRRASAHAQ